MPIESWIAKNLTVKSFTLDIPSVPSFLSGSQIDLLQYTSETSVAQSARLLYLIQVGWLSVTKYHNGVAYIVITSKNASEITVLPQASSSSSGSGGGGGGTIVIPSGTVGDIVVLGTGGTLADGGKQSSSLVTLDNTGKLPNSIIPVIPESGVENLPTDLAGLQSTQTTLAGEITTLQTQVGTNTTNITNLTTEVGTYSTSISTLNSEVSTLMSEVGSYSSSISTLNSEVSVLTSEVGSYASSISTLNSEVATNTANIATNTSAITTINGEISTLNSEVSTNTGNISTLTSDVTSINSQLTTINDDITTINGDITAINTEISDLSGSITDTVGTPTDGSYAAGLFPFVPNVTTIADAIEALNDALQPLAPAPAPAFSNYTPNQTGATGKLSGYTVTGIGNVTAVSTDGTFTATSLSGKRIGIFSASQSSFTGVLAGGTSAGSGSPTAAYPANSFGNGNLGTLKIYANGTLLQSVDLTSFSSGSSLNGNGSGFTSLSAATDVQFPNGANFSAFKYRTGNWVVASADLVEGWNYIQIFQVISGTNYPVTALYMDLIRDLNTTATTTASESLTSLSMTGSNSISGVKYYTGGTASYSVTLNNLYKNTYSSSASAVSYNNGGTPLQSIAADSLPNSSGNTSLQFTGTKTVTINTSGTRLLNQSISVSATALRTVQNTYTTSGQSITNILLDNVSATSNTTTEGFDDEVYRLPSNSNFDSSSTAVTSSWTTTNTLVNSGSTGYNDGLQCYNSTLIYPSTNFSTITNGPSSNVNYSTGVTGSRTYYRFFDMSPTARSNYTITVNGTATPIAYGTSFTNSTNQIKIAIKLPNGSSAGTGWMDVTQLFATAQFTDGSGALLSGSFSMNSAMSITTGTQSTGSPSVNGKVFIRISVPQGWTGNLSSISLVGA